MKLSLSGRLVEKNAKESAIGLNDFLCLAARCGYDAVDLRSSQLNPETDNATIVQLHRGLEAKKLELFAAQYNAPITTSEEEDRFSDFAFLVSRLGGQSIRLSAGPDILKKASQIAAVYQLNIHYQMHTNSPFESIVGAADVIKEIGEDNFGLVPEPANLALAAQPFTPDMLKPLAGHIMGVHVQTLVVRPDGVNALKLCDGTEVRYTRVPYAQNDAIPFATFFEALRNAGFDGYVNELEPKPADDNYEAIAIEAAQFLRQFLA